MEHLLSSVGASHINIPYLGTEKFEAGCLRNCTDLENFKGYLHRKNWVLDRTTARLVFGTRGPNEIAEFLQTAFYFGCLISVFRTVQIPIQTSDFLENCPKTGKIFVRTTRLQALIGAWIAYEESAPTTKTSSKYDREQTISEMVNYTSYFLTLFCEKSQDMSEPHKSQMHLIELSIMALGESLGSAFAVIYGRNIQDMPTWGPSSILKARLLKNGWCVSDAPFFPESTTRAAISAEYYFGGRQCPWPRGNHSKCTATICEKYCANVNEETYEQKHVFPECHCSANEVPHDDISRIISKDIPLVRWDSKALTVSVAGPRTKYVAISHVWSDGLGSRVNALPTCQLTQIQSLVNELYKEPHRSSNHDMLPATIHLSDDDDDDNDMVPFWIDTLCVPSWKDDLRKAAIRNMGNIYRRADRVLVLDAHLLRLPRSADIVEKYAGIHLSTWHHRLWTLQEGQLAQSLYFQLADGAESFYDMNYVELQRFDSRLPKNLCSPLRSLCARELEAFYRYDEGKAANSGSGGDGDGDDLPARMRSCAKYLRSRHTSRSADEPLCVATILGLDPGKLLETSDRVKRMARFYDLVGRFDPRIIFHEHPRLPEEGYRWAPSFFLQQTPDLITLRENSFLDLPPVSIIPSGGGLPVQLAGFEISGFLETATSCQAGRPPVYFRPETPFPVPLQQWSWSQKTAWFSCAYTLELLPDADGKLPNIGDYSGKKERYAAILPGFLHPDYLPAIGVLGLIVADGNGTRDESKLNKKDWTKGSGRPGNQIPAHVVPWRISVNYVCRVRVSLPPAEAIPRGMSFATGKAFGRDQMWCIR